MQSLYQLLQMVLTLYSWMVIASAILSWLIAFRVVNPHNQAVYIVGDFLYRVTEPALRPIRRLLPHLGGIDISPLVLLLLLFFLQNLLAEYWPR